MRIIRYMNLPDREPHWVTENRLSLLNPDNQMRRHLVHSGSLTRKIVQSCSSQFRVDVVMQKFSAINHSERQLLGLRSGSTANVRSVLLYCGEHPWVFAHTVIPHYALKRSLRRLTQLGNRSLGAVLHSSRVMERSTVEYAELLPQHLLFQEAAECLNRKPASLWGRRILYQIDGDPLLVNEIFLPRFPN
ncbi:MAG: chorismate lyase [Gammaproteobacteria bacterium]|uniref:Probable chorismate pyruvate-lyase n=1 Tax=Candidatus Thiopontia autotrophica TaxID=2841688 RepID=A0A8J6P7N9_9GAMM|nr:chorismate lyase [Candidatus Thiopontia autotrophica]MBL6969037.1 chorismate lyase [Gammaproteobacteria bacterium]